MRRIPLESKYDVDTVTGCWIWKKPLPDGYGLVRTNGRQMVAHRLTYELHKGPIANGLELDHLCKNRSCVNPEHLEAVTPAINTQRSCNAKLSVSIAKEIREKNAAGISIRELAAQFNISEGVTSGIVTGRSWKNAGGPIRLSRKRSVTVLGGDSNEYSKPQTNEVCDFGTGAEAEFPIGNFD